jgi:hypothetical protein
VAEKACATFGIIFVMIMISQAFIYPVVMRTIQMKEEGWTTAARFREFPWLLSDLVFPFVMEYLVSSIWLIIYYMVLTLPAFLVPHLGNGPQHPGRAHQICRSIFLRRLVELCVLGSVRSRLEPACA